MRKILKAISPENNLPDTEDCIAQCSRRTHIRLVAQTFILVHRLNLVCSIELHRLFVVNLQNAEQSNIFQEYAAWMDFDPRIIYVIFDVYLNVQDVNPVLPFRQILDSVLHTQFLERGNVFSLSQIRDLARHPDSIRMLLDLVESQVFNFIRNEEIEMMVMLFKLEGNIKGRNILLNVVHRKIGVGFSWDAFSLGSWVIVVLPFISGMIAIFLNGAIVGGILKTVSAIPALGLLLVYLSSDPDICLGHQFPFGKILLIKLKNGY